MRSFPHHTNRRWTSPWYGLRGGAWPGSTRQARPVGTLRPMSERRCDRPDCSRPASASLSYRYADGSVWVGDLDVNDPSLLHLCSVHADRLLVPKGWELIDLRTLGAPTEAVA